MTRLIKALGLLLVSVTALAQAAEAHGVGELTAENALYAWGKDIDIYTVTLIAALVYLTGALRRWKARNAPAWWRHLSFLAGLALVFLALESPVDAIAEHTFWVHQIQHLLLRMAGPMLIMLAGPDTTFLAGLPRALRRGMVRPLAGNGAMQRLGRFLAHPVPVFLIFFLSLAVWEYPPFHNAALADPALHYLMHITMLLAGLIFFHAIFDRRLPPASLGYGWRQMVLLLSVFANIAVGAATALKATVWYGAYDEAGRLFTQSPLMDEQIGGYVIWVPGSMMLIVSIMVAIYGWNASETLRVMREQATRSGSNMAAMLAQPQTAEELWIKVEKPNRAVAFGLATMSISIFVLLMSTMVVMHAAQ